MYSCGEDTKTDETQIFEGTGIVWHSGGLMYCATQIRMENGDTLIPNQLIDEIMRLKTGNRVRLKYHELAIRESGCTIGKDCKIIEVKVAD